MDPALEEPVATILWAAPRLMTDVPELIEVSKYAIQFSMIRLLNDYIIVLLICIDYQKYK